MVFCYRLDRPHVRRERFAAICGRTTGRRLIVSAPISSEYPFTFCRSSHGVLHASDELLLSGGAHDVEFEKRGGRREVNVIVAESRQHELSLQIDDASLFAFVALDIVIRANEDDLAFA